MNERIKELIQQATRIVDGGPDMFSMPREIFDQELFADLLIRECLKIVEPTEYEDSNDEWCVTLRGTAQEIKEYFGVEK